MAEFLGMDVRLYLTNGQIVDGRVASIDQRTQLIALQDATTKVNGNVLRYGAYQVPGQDIKDLQIIPPGGQNDGEHRNHRNVAPEHYPVSQTVANVAHEPSTQRMPVHSVPSPLYHENAPTRPPPPPTYISQPQRVPIPQSPVSSNSSNVLPQSLGGHSQKPPMRSKSAFVDPAIISMAPKAPTRAAQSAARLSSTPTLEKTILSRQHTPPLVHISSSQGSGSRAGKLKGISHPILQPDSLTVTESELDEEEVDFSAFNSVSEQESRTPAVRTKNGQRRERDARRTGKQPGSKLRPTDGPSPASRQRKNRRAETFEGDVAAYSDDFDFQAGLSQFDKRRVFAEIREGDSTAPETLLVNLNRLRKDQVSGLQKLGIRDMVLDSVLPSGDETGNDAEVESDNESDGITVDDMSAAEYGMRAGAPRKRACRAANGVFIPSISPSEMIEVERITASETGPSDEQMIENGGRGAAMLVLQALGGSRRIKPGNHNEGPLVVVLVGNNKLGAHGLCAARHLANHECNVIVCAVGAEAELVNAVATQQKCFFPTGGKLTRGVVDLPHPSSQPVDIIIDALLGSYQTLLDLSEHDKSLVCDLMQWANENKANVLSLDIASGLNGNTGQPMSPTHYISPKWTLALGLPKIGHTRAFGRELTGELFLADLGIPRIVIQRAKKMANQGRTLKYIPPFGDKFVIGLEVVDIDNTASMNNK
ncbi:YjeF N-terminal domain-containing protein [Phlyctochytrium arcticum]|nr:YjeF N-terminal domain-containing protein [Phlyctochytrium arcticum]